MDHLQNLTTTRLLLRQGIEKGLWTLEDLDRPSMGWKENAERFRRHHPKYQQHEYRNPLRDETPESTERVEVVSPRDFGPAPNPKPSEPSEPEELDGVTIYSNSPDLFF